MTQYVIQELNGKLLWVEVKGNLELIGTDQNLASIQVDRDQDLQVSVSHDRITVYCEKDMQLTAPAGTNIHVTKAHRDALVRDWSGQLEIDGVGGDLATERTAGFKVQNVGGDCSIHAASGPVEINSVGGDFSGKDLQSDVKVNHVGSDFQMVNAAGNVTAQAGSDIHLSLTQTTGQSINLRAGSDVSVHLPLDPDVDLRATSGGQSIHISLGGSTEHRETGWVETSFGRGGTRLEIVAGADIVISDEQSDRESKEGIFAGSAKRAQWEDRVAHKTAKAFQKAEKRLARAERQAERASRRGQEALRRAEERVQDAMRRIEARRQGQSGFTFGVSPSDRSTASNDPAYGNEPAGATEEERMIILQMVQEKKITVEEADRLLAVLEGSQE